MVDDFGIREFNVAKYIFKRCSSFFRNMLSFDCVERDTNTVEITDFRAEVVERALHIMLRETYW